MKPIFRVIADSIDITLKIQQRLISIKTVDEAGLKSDQCTIELDDRDGLISLPRHGAQLIVWMGYESAGLTQLGIYTVDEVTLSGFPATLSINAKATDMINGLKSPKTRYFDGITMGDLVKTVAGDHGLTGKTAADMAALVLGHVDQTQESDLNLLTRMAQKYGGIAKITNDFLVVAKAGQSKSASGINLSSIAINKNMVSDYHCSIADRNKYAAVTATWHNKATGQNISVSTSEEKPSFTLRHTCDDQQQAIDAAKAKLESLRQGTSTVDVTLAIGNPNLYAESPLTLLGFRTGISDQGWTATRVEHSFSESGFTTRVSGEVK